MIASGGVGSIEDIRASRGGTGRGNRRPRALRGPVRARRGARCGGPCAPSPMTLGTILVVLLAAALAAFTYLVLERTGRRGWVPLVCRTVAWAALGLLLLNVSCPVAGVPRRPLVLLDASLSLTAPGDAGARPVTRPRGGETSAGSGTSAARRTHCPIVAARCWALRSWPRARPTARSWSLPTARSRTWATSPRTSCPEWASGCFPRGTAGPRSYPHDGSGAGHRRRLDSPRGRGRGHRWRHGRQRGGRGRSRRETAGRADPTASERIGAGTARVRLLRHRPGRARAARDARPRGRRRAAHRHPAPRDHGGSDTGRGAARRPGRLGQPLSLPHAARRGAAPGARVRAG